jgi:hypothetical protein
MSNCGLWPRKAAANAGASAGPVSRIMASSTGNSLRNAALATINRGKTLRVD